MKHLILSASCPNEFASDTPDIVTVTLDSDDIQQIKKVVATLRELHSSNFFLNTSQWFDGGSILFDMDDPEEELDSIEKVKDQLKGAVVAMECRMVVVRKSGITLTAVPDGCASSLGCYSALVPLEFLDDDSDETYIDLGN